VQRPSVPLRVDKGVDHVYSSAGGDPQAGRLGHRDWLNPTFSQLFATEGCAMVSHEQLPLASLLYTFHGIRSKRLLLEQPHKSSVPLLCGAES
jgi:hypothetical protein